jgi:hypothetical protein
MNKLLLLIFISTNIFAISNSEISKKWSIINDSLSIYVRDTFSLTDVSAKGASCEAFKNKNMEIKAIYITYYGEMGRTIDQYFYDKSDVFFIRSTEYHYNAPIPKENYNAIDNKNERYDETKSIVEETEYYCYNDTFFQCKCPNSKIKFISTIDCKHKGYKVIKAAKDIYLKASHF